MADPVITKAVTANDIKNGDAQATVDKNGNSQVLDRGTTEGNGYITRTTNWLGDRMDNPTYY